MKKHFIFVFVLFFTICAAHVENTNKLISELNSQQTIRSAEPKAAAGNCTGTTCSGCVSEIGCGWCAPTQACLPGNAAGPTGGLYCTGDAWQYKTCTTCQGYKTCTECSEHDLDCFWCRQSSSCVPYSFPGCRYTPSCPCDSHSTCSECTASTDCTWCGGQNQTCIETSDIGSCPAPQQSCPCSSNLDCFTCKNDFGCEWCDRNATCVGIGSSDCPLSHSCNNYCGLAADCTSCQNQRGCGWCATERTCVDIAVSTCTLLPQCPQCSHHSYCSACQDDPNCSWCPGTQTCVVKETTDTSCSSATFPTCEDYCNSFGSCSSCSNVKGCGWCGDTSICSDYTSVGCLLSHSCAKAKPTCKFDAAAFLGGMFLSVGLVIVGIAAYAFYRWKNSSPAYSPIKG